MFETYDVPAMYIAVSGALALCSTSCTTGIVLDCGATLSSAVPVFEGYVLSHAIMQVRLAGRDLTDYLLKLLEAGGRCFTTDSGRVRREVVRDLKENGCSQNARCLELLFAPSLIGNDSPGIHMITYDSIMRCDSELRRELFGCIVLSGGTTMFEGFESRLERELVYLAPATTKIKIVAQPDRKYAAWIGGSWLASQPSMRWISRADYSQGGVSIVHRKCI